MNQELETLILLKYGDDWADATINRLPREIVLDYYRLHAQIIPYTPDWPASASNTELIRHLHDTTPLYYCEMFGELKTLLYDYESENN